jgi:hypothetical protein
VENLPEARKVVSFARRNRQLEQADKIRGHKSHMRHAMVFDGAQRLLRIEGFHDHVGATRMPHHHAVA